MRPSLLPGLLTAVKRNRNRGFADAALFELGQAYRGDKPDDQYISAAGVRAGTAGLGGSGRHWDGAAQDVDVFDAKADAVAVLAALGFDPSKAQITRDAPAWYHPGRSGTLRLGPKTVLAHFGEMHPATLKALDVAAPVAAFEVFLDALPAAEDEEPRQAAPRSGRSAAGAPRLRLRARSRCRRRRCRARRRRRRQGADPRASRCSTCSRAARWPTEGKKSLAIEVTLQPTAETLTDKDIEAVVAEGGGGREEGDGRRDPVLNRAA